MSIEIVPLIPGWMGNMFLIAGIVLLVIIGAGLPPGAPENDDDLETWDNGLAEVGPATWTDAS